MSVSACPYHPGEDTPPATGPHRPAGTAELACGYPATSCASCETANRAEARFCRGCGVPQTPPDYTKLSERVLAGIWDDAVDGRTPEPYTIRLPEESGSVTAIGRAGGFLLVGTDQGEVISFNGFSPGNWCERVSLRGSVVGFSEWRGGYGNSIMGEVPPGVVVTTASGLFHLPFGMAEQSSPFWQPGNGRRLTVGSVAMGDRLLAFPSDVERTSPVLVCIRREGGSEAVSLEVSLALPMSAPITLGDGRVAFLGDGLAVIVEPDAPHPAVTVRLAYTPDPVALPSASETDLFYVYQKGDYRGVARLGMDDWTSYRVTAPDFATLQVVAISRKAICIGTGDDFALLSARDGTVLRSRRIHQNVDNFSHDRFPPLRVGEYLLVCTTSRKGQPYLEIVPLSATGFDSGLHEVLRLESLEVAPVVVPGGVVVAGARGSGLTVLRARSA
ncbi:MAG: hypothetical protein JWM27_2432 [Gemmatimonadetes bacterium]|nr:hypothetical protein [Gemmatimonadota bacterium]